LLVACPSRLAAEHCCRRARLFGLQVAGPVAIAAGWLVAVAPTMPAPASLSVRFGAGPAALAPRPAQQLLF
jgi:hypothetical protein